MKAGPKTKLGQWQRKSSESEAVCSRCQRTYYLTVDHIIPVNILYALNLVAEVYDWEENYEIICGACNKLKGGNLDVSNPKTYPLLEEAIRRSKAQRNETNPSQTA